MCSSYTIVCQDQGHLGPLAGWQAAVVFDGRNITSNTPSSDFKLSYDDGCGAMEHCSGVGLIYFPSHDHYTTFEQMGPSAGETNC